LSIEKQFIYFTNYLPHIIIIIIIIIDITIVVILVTNT